MYILSTAYPVLVFWIHFVSKLWHAFYKKSPAYLVQENHQVFVLKETI
jgi:hypothetical protein